MTQRDFIDWLCDQDLKTLSSFSLDLGKKQIIRSLHEIKKVLTLQMALKCFPKGLVTGTPPPKLMAEIQGNKTSRSSRAGDTFRSISTPKGDIQPANQTEFCEDDILELSNYLDDIYNNSSKFTFLLTALFTRFVTLVLSVITFWSEISQCRQVDCKTPGDSIFIKDILKLLIFRNSKAITVINTLPASFLSYMDILWSNFAWSNAHSEISLPRRKNTSLRFP